jgi:hypothetical protein
LLLCFCSLLASCSTYNPVDYITHRADDHAISSQGTGFNIYVDNDGRGFQVALDLKSAATAAVGWMPPAADFGSIAQEWAKMNRPRCQAKEIRQLSSGRFQYSLGC